MPGRVTRVRWKCERCGKQRWYVPSLARTKRFCSRACLWKSLETHGERKSSGRPRIYGARSCIVCGASFEARWNHQKCCSQACAVRRAQDARRKHDPTAQRICEHCGQPFHPRPTGVGRFCSVNCRDAGRSGARSGSWKGGRHVTRDGYVRVLVGRGGGRHGLYALEHRVVMEQTLGRRLQRWETVHHINGNRVDNRPENLQLRMGRHGNGVVLQCAECGSRQIVKVPIADPLRRANQ